MYIRKRNISKAMQKSLCTSYAQIVLTGTYLNSKVDPLLKVLTPLAPLEIHPTGIMNPNGNVTIITNTLILLGNIKLRTITHDTPGRCALSLFVMMKER